MSDSFELLVDVDVTLEEAEGVAQAVLDRLHTLGLICARAAARRSITEWECQPPLGFGNLSIRFWNWPPLDSSSWKINIPGTVEDVTCHKIVMTHGHL